MLGILIDVRWSRDGKISKTTNYKKVGLKHGVNGGIIQGANIIKNSTASEDTPIPRGEWCETKAAESNGASDNANRKQKKAADAVLDTSTGSEMDMDTQIEEMNSRIQDMEDGVRSLGWKSPPSPTQLITKRTEYHVDDAVEADNGGKNSTQPLNRKFCRPKLAKVYWW